jgi:hypothetical protein
MADFAPYETGLLEAAVGITDVLFAYTTACMELKQGLKFVYGCVKGYETKVVELYSNLDPCSTLRHHPPRYTPLKFFHNLNSTSTVKLT